MSEILNFDKVHGLAMSCLASQEEGALIVDGITARFGFDAEKIAARKLEIATMLAELPDQFFRDAGGGWTFLNLCNDKHGEQWTDLHSAMEALCVLAIAAGMGRWVMPREFWSAFPGGMPYVVFERRPN